RLCRPGRPRRDWRRPLVERAWPAGGTGAGGRGPAVHRRTLSGTPPRPAGGAGRGLAARPHPPPGAGRSATPPARRPPGALPAAVPAAGRPRTPRRTRVVVAGRRGPRPRPRPVALLI